MERIRPESIETFSGEAETSQRCLHTAGCECGWQNIGESLQVFLAGLLGSDGFREVTGGAPTHLGPYAVPVCTADKEADQCASRTGHPEGRQGGDQSAPRSVEQRRLAMRSLCARWME